jgi:hypothetical protein
VDDGGVVVGNVLADDLQVVLGEELLDIADQGRLFLSFHATTKLNQIKCYLFSYNHKTSTHV